MGSHHAHQRRVVASNVQPEVQLPVGRTELPKGGGAAHVQVA